MSRNVSGKFWTIASRLLDEERDVPSESQKESMDELSAQVKAAKQEWLNAQSYFNQATEPELVDHAIISLQAAERKYMYWLKQMKNSE